MEKQQVGTNFWLLNKTDGDLRIEALRQAMDIWKHWDENGHPEGDETIISVAKSFHTFLTGQRVDAEARSVVRNKFS